MCAGHLGQELFEPGLVPLDGQSFGQLGIRCGEVQLGIAWVDGLTLSDCGDCGLPTVGPFPLRLLQAS